MTTAEYLDTPETLKPTELAYGAFRVADSPLAPHQRMVGNLFLALTPYVRARGLGDVWLAPFDVVLDADQALVVQPDLLFISEARREIVREHVYGAPDLVIEVLSPHPRVGSISEKLEWYGRYGVRECWLVHQLRRQIEILGWSGGRPTRRVHERYDRLSSTVLPGFDLSLDDIVPGYAP